MHVLFLTPWYPNKWDVMDGIFVRKHAQAVSRMEKVTVVYAHSDATQKDFAVNVKEDGNLTEILIYYPGPSTGVMSALVKAVNFMRAIAYGVGLAESRVGKIDVCQVSVMTRCAVMAWWLQHKQGVKYYILEHWLSREQQLQRVRPATADAVCSQGVGGTHDRLACVGGGHEGVRNQVVEMAKSEQRRR